METRPHSSDVEPGLRPSADILLKAGAFVLLLAALWLVFRFLPLEEPLAAVLRWSQEAGPWGPVLLVVLYTMATVLMVPGTILTLAAGFAFGLVVGTIAASAGSVLGALAAFLIGRTWARDLVERKVSQYRSFRAIDRAVARQGFTIVLLLRLSPVFPYNLLNYVFGITQVSTRDYVLASWLGMLPATVLYVYLGTAAKTVAELATGRVEGGPWQNILLSIGLVATAIVTVLVTQMSRNAMRELLEEESSGEE